MVSNKFLAKIATYVAIGGISSVMLLRSKVQDQIRQAQYFKDALILLRTHPGAVNILGEPIKEMGFDLEDSKANFATAEACHFEVAVKGPKERGTLYFWGVPDIENKKWNLTRVELELKSDKSKRLVIRKSE